MTDAGALIGRYLGAGNFAAAEYICRRVLIDRTGEESAALLGLAAIARRFWRLEHEAIFLDRLAAPFATRFRDPLPLDHITIGKTTDDGSRPRFLLINPWGEGFWSDVSHVVGCCILAWLTNRIPVTNWRTGSLYSDRRGEDAYIDFFEPINTVSTSDIDLEGLSIQPNHWTSELFLGQSAQALPERLTGMNMQDVMISAADIVVCDKYISPAGVLRWVIPSVEPTREELADHLTALVARCCRPNEEWIIRARDYVDRTFQGEPFLAIHLRGTDKVREHSRSESIARRIADTAERLSDGKPIFLMTDDESWREAMATRFGDRLHFTDATRIHGRSGVHRAPLDADMDGAGLRRRLGGEILTDSLIAAQAETFVGDGESNVAAMIDLMMPRRSARSELLSPNQLLDLRDWGLIAW